LDFASPGPIRDPRRRAAFSTGSPRLDRCGSQPVLYSVRTRRAGEEYSSDPPRAPSGAARRFVSTDLLPSTTVKPNSRRDSSAKRDPSREGSRPQDPLADFIGRVRDGNVLGALLDAVPGLLFLSDAEGRLLWTSERLHDFIRSEALWDREGTLSSVCREADRSTVREAVERAGSTGEAVTIGTQLVTEGPNSIPCLFTASPLPDDDGQVGEVIGIAREEPDAHTRYLEHERDRLATLYAELPSPVVHYEVSDREAIVRGVNRAFETVFGVSESEADGQNLDRLIAPSNRTAEAGALTRQALKDGDVQAEVVRKTEDGPRHFRLDSVLYSGEGSPEGYAIYTDLTTQKEREQTLREEEAALRSMYRITADRKASFEEKITRLLDLGRTHLDLPYGFLTRISEGTQRVVHAAGEHPLLQPEHSCPLSQAYCRKTIQEDSLLAVQNASAEGWDGDPAYETFGLGCYIGSQVIVHGDLYGTFCFAASEPRSDPFSDREQTFVELITRWTSYELEQRHVNEQLERRNERLDSFASLVTHDLRNPLNVAKGRLELAKDQDEMSHVQAVGRALDRMEEIIDDVLALSRGRQTVAPEDVEACALDRLATACWDHVQTEESTLQVADAPIVWADEGRLRQVLENLFRNAVEHGGNQVTVRVGRLGNGFFVEDDGTGIPGDDRENIFETGYTTSQNEGTGLGLSIVESISEAHGWCLALTESRDGGARFEVTDVDVET